MLFLFDKSKVQPISGLYNVPFDLFTGLFSLFTFLDKKDADVAPVV